MIKTMRAIEYNTWTSIISSISTDIKDHYAEYGLGGKTISIMPSYPKDLTKFTKPSIIVQKINVGREPLSFGNVLGQYYDEESNTLYDISGMRYDFSFQINVEASGNIECSLISSLICENTISGTIPLFDFVTDFDNPIPIGMVSIDSDVDCTSLSSNETKDYMQAIRFDAKVIQTIVPQQDIVDLGKGFNIKQTIKL